MTVTTYKWTVDRYHQAINAGLFDDQPLELLNGDLVVMSPEREPHAYYNSEVGDYLRQALGNRAKVREAHPIALGHDSEPIPDLAIVQPLGRLYLEHHPYPNEIFWLVEFSYTTLAKDLNEKKIAYAEAGILEYWVINLKDNQLHVFRDPQESSYTTSEVLVDGTISPTNFNGLQLDVRKLIGY